MTVGMDDYRYVLVYEIGREQHIETFYTKQEMEQFIERDDVHPLFQYEEKAEYVP